MHSHNYTPQQAYKRSFGEAKALAAVWHESPKEINFPKTVLLGWTNDARRDLIFCSQQKCLREWPHAVRIRWKQRRAKLAGFREGWKFYRNGNGAGHNGHQFGGIPPSEQKTNGVSSRPSSAAPPRNTGRLLRFTMDGSAELENHLARTCETVLAGVQAVIPAEKLDALVLGGGYGRGQGGVLKTNSGDAPYNDLEFYVFLRGNRVLNERTYHPTLEELGARLSGEAGLHVEFKVDSLERLRRSPVTMFSYDLVSGHRILFGGENVFAGCEHHRDAVKIPLAEAARLLFNRCTGLLLTKELLQKRELTAEDSDFVGRNLAKAQLALGDAVLAAEGKYHWSCLERKKALAELSIPNAPPWLQEVRTYHAAGVDFKLHPQRIAKSRTDFQTEHEAISWLAREIWLWLESRRLNQTFSSARDYAFDKVEKCNGVPIWRNILLNAKTFGTGGIFSRTAGRYPRERLLNSLPLLLWVPLNDLRVKYFLQKELRTTASDWQGFVTAYKAVWPKFS
jgi:hypothetical protein